MILIGLVKFFHLKQSDFGNNKWFLNYIQKKKCGKNLLKQRLYEKLYNFKTNQDFLFKF